MNTRTPDPAARQAPSVETEMAKFTGFSTNNGETVDPKTTAKGAETEGLSEEEKAAGATLAAGAAKTGEAKTSETKAPAKVTLTDDEADAALNKARTDLKLADGEELTKEEEDEALLAALTTKKEASKPAATDRVKRAEGRAKAADRRAAAAEQKNADLERRLAALEAGGGKAPLTGDTKKANDATSDKEPDPKDFEFGEVDAKYIRALARFEAKQAIASSSKSENDEARTRETERAQAEYTEKKAAFEDAGLEAFDDFQEVVMDTVNLPKSDPAAWPLSATVGELLLESEHGPAIAYQLASDTKEAKRVFKLTASQQAAWFGKQEAKLETGQAGKEKPEDTDRAGREVTKETKARTVSRAPLPLDRGRGAGGNKTVSAATTDFRAFEAMAAQPARR